MKNFVILMMCLNVYSFIESAENCENATQGQCGGILGRTCCSPLTCIYGGNSNHPNFPDEGGICSNCHKVGKMCAGFAGFQCCPGLQCIIKNPDPQMSDQAGTCVRPKTTTTQIPGCKPKGKMCGGIAGFICCSGLRCKMAGTYPDASGTCV